MSERFSSLETRTDNSVEKARAKDAWRDLQAGEQSLLAEGGAKLIEVIKKGGAEKARAFAAALVFFSGTTPGAEPDTLRAQSETPSYEMVQENQNPSPAHDFEGITLPFDWRDMVEKLTARESKEDEARVETISMPQESYIGDSVMSSSFYKNISPLEYGQSLHATTQAVLRSGGKEAGYNLFVDTLKDANLNEQQKLISLQRIGSVLLETYNTDMLKDGQYVKISEEDMLVGVQEYYRKKPWEKTQPTGICGNIETFLTKTANELGVDAWLQSGIVGGENPAGHVWAGLVAKDAEGVGQIAFLNYGTLIPTGTMDYRLALGIMERYHKDVALFDSYIGTTERVLAPIQSIAQETIASASGLGDSATELENRLNGNPEPERTPEGVSMSEKETTITFSGDTLGFSFRHMEDSENPYQAIQNMDAVRASVRFGNKYMGGTAEATLLNMSLKDIGKGVFSQDEIIKHLERHFINEHSFTEKNLGEFVIRYGATIETGMRHILDSTLPTLMNTETSKGVSLLFTDPNKVGTFYIGALDTANTQKSDFQTQKILTEKLSETLYTGANITVREGTILNLEHRATDLNYGEKKEIKAGITERDAFARVQTEQTVSDIPYAVPSTEKITAEAGFNFGKSPRTEILVFGTSEETEYNTASDKKQAVGIKLRMLLW